MWRWKRALKVRSARRRSLGAQELAACGLLCWKHRILARAIYGAISVRTDIRAFNNRGEQRCRICLPVVDVGVGVALPAAGWTVAHVC